MTAPGGSDPAAVVAGDDAIAAALRTQGFAQVPMLTDAEVSLLRAAFHVAHPEPGAGTEADTVNPDEAYRRRTSALLAEVLDPAIRRALGDVRIVLHSFVCKWPGEDSAKPLHRDWSYAPEPPFRSYSIWIPLVDVDEGNGALEVLPGSHDFDDQRRGSCIEPGWIEHEALVRPRLVTQRCRAGVAMVYDSGLLHGSAPNLDTMPREVAGAIVVPGGAPLVHYRRRGTDEVEVYDVDEDFHRRYSALGLYEERPDLEPAAVLPARAADLSAEELLGLMGPEPRRRRRLLPRRPPRADRERWARPAGPIPDRPTLADPVDDADLATKGALAIDLAPSTDGPPFAAQRTVHRGRVLADGAEVDLSGVAAEAGTSLLTAVLTAADGDADLAVAVDDPRAGSVTLSPGRAVVVATGRPFRVTGPAGTTCALAVHAPIEAAGPPPRGVVPEHR